MSTKQPERNTEMSRERGEWVERWRVLRERKSGFVAALRDRPVQRTSVPKGNPIVACRANAVVRRAREESIERHRERQEMVDVRTAENQFWMVPIAALQEPKT